MFTLLFVFCMFGVFGKLFCFGLMAAWGISKFVLYIVETESDIIRVMFYQREREPEGFIYKVDLSGL